MFDVYLRRVVEGGKAVFPRKFVLTDEEIKMPGNENKKSVESLKRQLDAWLFSGQYLNDPVDIDTVEFKPHWFQTFRPSEELSLKLRNAPTIFTVDPAFRLKQTNDCSGLVVAKVTSDNLVYVVEAIKRRLNPKQLIDEIFRIVGLYKPYRVMVETVSAQIVLIPLLQEEMRKKDVFFQVEELKPSTNETKAARIRGLVPHYANARIFHAPNMKELEAELIEFPRGAHDDLIDALSYQIPFWKAGSVSQPTQEAPYWSLNWFKSQRKAPVTRIGGMFADLMPVRRF